MAGHGHPIHPTGTPGYVFDLLRALVDGGPVDFQAHAVPDDVQAWLWEAATQGRLRKVQGGDG